ncbi:hypothetical protein Ahy_B04g070217 isoform E [Arachis hypogaea]|uniref:Fungal lipase-type domain-containing protein n=1 Tax=Arachis hypogaea TaxID=3818 RepID=A0A444ZFV8_ARAHY|nr:hypothetical protein Ahy_B04g070217 isoform E [Arachis hypogaea]
MYLFLQLLRPAFTIIRDTQSKCLLLLIRGTHSIKDTLTAATGISNLVLGYAHCGMVAAARWIAKLCTPTLLKALGESPDFKVKIVGHSLGGGTAALLTYILREQKEFSTSTCVTFAPAACMTWELAESGSDLVPTFSTASIDDLRSEVTASSWINDLRDQVEHTRVLNVVYRSATALGSHLPSISSAKARVAGAGAILWPVTSGTQQLLAAKQDISDSTADHITEGQLWYELEKELQKQENSIDIDVQEEEAAAAKEITEEENQLVDAAEGSNSITTSENVDSHRFYPPGRIMHIVCMPSPVESNSDDPVEEHVGLFETPRELYSKLRLSRTMINDHYMPMYKKMMELLIRELEKDTTGDVIM